MQSGFLTARYISPSNYEFEFGEVYRLHYKLDNGKITVEDALASKVTYDSITEFQDEWDINDVPERYRKHNPTL